MKRATLVSSVSLAAVALAAAGPLRAPDRFRIWRAGANPGDYGELVYDDAADASVMGEYSRRGNLLVMDIEHALNPIANPTLNVNDPPMTAGYLALERVDTKRGPELWGVPRWSDCGREAPVPDEVCCAKHQIESGQRCYVSPDWDIDLETRRPIRLNRVSLVAEPATWGINLLASASRAGRQDMDQEQLRAAYASAMKMAAGGDEASKAYCASLKASAEKAGINLDEEPGPKSERGEGQATKASAESEPGKKEAEMATKVAGKGLSLDELDRHLELRDEKARLLEANKDRIHPGHLTMLAGKGYGLPEVKNYIAGLPLRPVAGGTEGDAGGTVGRGAGAGSAGRAAEDVISPRDEFAAETLRKKLGVSKANVVAAKAAIDSSPAIAEAFDIKIPPGTYAFSFVDQAEKKAAERQARKGA
jgi:hypothetical protein